MFASTFTERLSAAPHLFDAIAAEVAQGARFWLLTLHPKCPPSLFERAAQRAGLSTVFIPQRNEADLDDVPADVLEALNVRPMTDVAEIVAQALEPAAEAVTVAA